MQRFGWLDGFGKVGAVGLVVRLNSKSEVVTAQKIVHFLSPQSETRLHTCLHTNLNGEKTRRKLLIMHGTNYS
jgi:hypothetical protein